MEADKDSQTFFRQADARVVIPRESARFCTLAEYNWGLAEYNWGLAEYNWGLA